LHETCGLLSRIAILARKCPDLLLGFERRIAEKTGCRHMDDFEARLVAAYDAWHTSRGRSPEGFFALYAEDIELHSILEAARIDEVMRGPFVGKSTALAYFTAIAEAWEMVAARVDRFVSEGDTVVVVGHATWRNLKTLRVVDGPKVDVWTVRDGLAAHYLEMFDSYGTARALGLVDPPDGQPN